MMFGFYDPLIAVRYGAEGPMILQDMFPTVYASSCARGGWGRRAVALGADGTHGPPLLGLQGPQREGRRWWVEGERHPRALVLRADPPFKNSQIP